MCAVAAIANAITAILYIIQGNKLQATLYGLSTVTWTAITGIYVKQEQEREREEIED
ncbi:hypothetical protein [Bifidobacterium callimiconis]|uniref:Uncharacterized protein n=1 Tax=Bifidobacterium callimiconis TaxID=2306973 RepID=A0A430FGU4_9BIFI|nr:hypothetical protein [Bifidobacterium callimiconis]MBT1176532.1 hypothetical protein [Bifidobacterium callimiconis]RSX52011.1 hypothetical protein D2E23_0618 [Bifidobacterium callimiconis]